MNRVRVLTVEDGRVVLRAGNVEFVFGWDPRKKGAITEYGRSKDAQILEGASSLRVPDDVYREACRRAAAILRDRKKKRRE